MQDNPELSGSRRAPAFRALRVSRGRSPAAHLDSTRKLPPPVSSSRPSFRSQRGAHSDSGRTSLTSVQTVGLPALPCRGRLCFHGPYLAKTHSASTNPGQPTGPDAGDAEIEVTPCPQSAQSPGDRKAATGVVRVQGGQHRALQEHWGG